MRSTPADPAAPTVASHSGHGVTQDASRASQSSNVLVVDEVLAGRYRIVKFLAQGGMGEVYEAIDLELHDRIALKTINARSTSSGPAIERFKREIHLARKVTHPNVCRIFDLGQHQPRGTTKRGDPLPPVVFLTMELLEGETLSRRLRRNGRMTTDQAFPVARQIADALEAAHGAGIVHRDLKSENVFLVPRPGESTRVVVTDFGVARGTSDDQFSSLVTGAGIVGTPAYMAPEQVEGGEITPAADIYAFGVVLYEMVTGRLPFESENPLTTAVKRLREPPPPPHLHVPHLEARWEKTILRCLARAPADRYGAAGDIVTDLERPRKQPEPEPAVAPTTAAAASSEDVAVPRRRRTLEITLLVVLALSAVLLWVNRGDEEDVTPRNSIAVLGFKNNNPQRPDVDWLSTALGEMLSTELARSENLRTIPGETVARARRELQLEPGESLAPDTLTRVRTLLGCDFVIVGSYLALEGPTGDRLRVDLKLQNASDGETLEALAREGSQNELFTMVDALGSGLREFLGLAAKAASSAPILPRDPEAARLYAEALEKLRNSEPLPARDLLIEAIALEPDHPMVHSALSNAWQALGHQAKALAAAREAFDQSAGLPEQERLLVEGRLRESEADWPAAIGVYERLWSKYPDDLEVGLRLTAAQTAIRRPADALETVREMRRLPPPLSEDPRIHLAEASAAALLSDFDRQLLAAEKASVRARELGADLLLAQARLAESQAWRLLGKADEASEAAEEAIALHRKMEDPSGEALATTAAANVEFDLGRLGEATEGFRRSIELYRQIGNQGSRAFALNNLALVLKRQGDFETALARYQEAEAIYAELGDDLGTANTSNNLAALRVEQGRLGLAQEMFERSLEAWETAGNRHAAAFVQGNIAVVLRMQGRLSDALDAQQASLETRRQLGHKAGVVVSLANIAATAIDTGELGRADLSLSEARTLATEIGDRSGLALARFESGRLLHLRADLDSALEDLSASLHARQDLDEGPRVTDTRLALARLRLDRGELREAEVEASLALGRAEDESRATEQALATLLLAELALARGDTAAAIESAERARELVRTSEQPAVQWRVDLGTARIEAAAAAADPASRAAALERVRSLRAEIDESGHVELALEARLEEGRLLADLGRHEEAREALIRLQTEASVLGFGFVTQRAEEILAEVRAAA